MPVGELLLGIGLLALTVGSAVVFAVLTVSRQLGGLLGAPRGLAVGLLAVTGFLAIHLVPGVLGLLGKPAVAVAALVLLGVSTRIPRRASEHEHEAYPPAPPSGRLSWALAGTVAALYATYVLALALDQGGHAVQTVDMTTFHLPNVAHWIQTGSLWHISDFVPHRAFGTYPNTSDVMTLGVVLPFRNDFLVHFVNYPALALLGVAVYALGRELGAPAAAGALFAGGLLAMPIVTEIAFEGLADTLMLASFGAGLVFLMRQRRTGARSDLVLAGVALGISFGTKWYAPPAVVLAILGWAALELARGRRRELLRGTGTLTAIVAALGGFWLLRNLVEVGDPVFPVKVAVGGITVFDAPRDIHRELFGSTLADYLGDPSVFRHLFWPTFLEFMSWFAILLWAMFPVAGLLAWRALRRERDSERAWSVLGLIGIAAAIALVYLVTPYTALGPAGQPLLAAANARYVMPALLIGAGVGAWASGRLGRLRPLLGVVALLAFLDALRRDTHVSFPKLAVAAVVVATVVGAAWMARKADHPRSTLRMAVAAVCGAVIVAGGLYLQERRFNDHRYTDGEATGRWVSLNAPSGHRIGVVGEGFIVYPMFGPRLRNEVEYVGPVVDGMLRTYARRAPFQAALGRGRYDLVLLQGAGLVEPGLPGQQEQWLRKLGYRLVASGSQDFSFHQPARLYRAPSRAHGS